MIFSVGVNRAAWRDLENILRPLPQDGRRRIEATADYLFRVEVREDVHLKGESYPGNPRFRKLVLGPLEVIVRLRPLDDRYVEVVHVRKREVTATS